MDGERLTRLRTVIPRLARVLTDSSRREGLTPTQCSVLALVCVHGPVGLAELAELEGLHPTMLSRIVKVLDERGLIRRMPSPGDMRVARVAATPEGKQVDDRVRGQHTRVLSDCLHDLPPETTASLLAAVPRLEALAEALKPMSKATHSAYRDEVRRLATASGAAGSFADSSGTLPSGAARTETGTSRRQPVLPRLV